MKFGGIVICRMDSRRLPGKTLREVCGRPLIWYVLERLRCWTVLQGNITVATSDRPVDRPIVRFCEAEGLSVFCGDATDVAGRIVAAADSQRYDVFYRINGDSPLIHTSLYLHARRIFLAGDLDLITNLKPRSFPYGISVELVRTSAFRLAHNGFTAEEREHPTLGLYRRWQTDRIFNIINDAGDFSRFRMTIDTQHDFDRFEQLVSSLDTPWAELSFWDALTRDRELRKAA